MGLDKIGTTIGKEIIAWTRTGASKSLLATKPVTVNVTELKLAPNLAKDSISFTNPIVEINRTLKNVYGIDSKLTNLPLAERVSASIKNFCSVNKKKDLFKGLELNCEVNPRTDSVITRSYDVQTGKYAIQFNEKYDFKNLDKITQDAYKAGEIPSAHPDTFFNIELGHFLNFKNNPIAYKVTTERSFCKESELISFKLSNSSNMADFNANYIAGRMSGQSYPKILYRYFEGNAGNTCLKFPKPTPSKINQGSNHKFTRISDAQKYLSDNYGIDAEFITTQQANYFAGAVDDMCKMTGDKTCFKGLKITQDFNTDNLNTQMSTHWNYATGEATMTINPAYNWKQEAKKAETDFHEGLHPTKNKKDKYIHELAHWLDFKGNPVKYGQTEISFSDGDKVFNEYGKSATSKVSRYAATSPAEFCAEYITGKFNGIKYPESVDNLFTIHWNGPKINFPQ